MFLSYRRLWRNEEKVLTEAVFGCYDTQVSDRKRRLTHMKSVHRTRCMVMEGMRMVSMRMMRCAQNMGSFGLRFVC